MGMVSSTWIAAAGEHEEEHEAKLSVTRDHAWWMEDGPLDGAKRCQLLKSFASIFLHMVLMQSAS